MGLTNAERQRRWRERQKARIAAAETGETMPGLPDPKSDERMLSQLTTDQLFDELHRRAAFMEKHYEPWKQWFDRAAHLAFHSTCPTPEQLEASRRDQAEAKALKEAVARRRRRGAARERRP